MGPLGQTPLCCLGPPPGSLNAPYATYKKCPNVNSPWQNGQSPHRQSTSTARIGSGPSPVSCAGSAPPTGLIQEVPPQQPQGRVGQVLILEHGHPASGCRIPPISLSVGICRTCSGPLEAGRLISLHLPCQHVEGIEAGIHLFLPREISHRKTQCIVKVGQKSMVEPVPPQILSLIGHGFWMCSAEDGHCLMDP